METYIDTNVILVHINLDSIYNKNSFQITQVPSTCESNLKYMFFNLNFLSNNIFFLYFPLSNSSQTPPASLPTQLYASAFSLSLSQTKKKKYKNTPNKN